ncbi:minor capsid protein [Schaalia sp. lx-100]|uniref:minor capsid protein n=1 Tax=Schaalia sp. lx-100 TaxID=2899081 RepID=UPI001E628629|nr:minor capsid protein [Schaalia sp. lx-100]MCD4558227.1 minor capsid protein [Schaalia sp. lx-100]
MQVHVTWNGPKIQAKLRGAQRHALRLAGEHLRTQSVQLTPIREGLLRASAAVSLHENRALAAVSFNTPYAVRQHEELGYRHPKGGQAKYLETAADDEKSTMERIVITTLERAGGK